MRVLFVLSGNRDRNSGLVENQARSLLEYESGIEVDYFFVKGKGMKGYLKNIKPLRQKIKSYNPQIVHAHYSFCGFLSVMALSRRRIVTSLMGSDIHLKIHWRLMLFVTSFFWSAIIVKSRGMQKTYLLTKTYVVPNGVDFKNYEFVDKREARSQLGLDPDKKYILFLADPERPEKNFKLTQDAYALLPEPKPELLVVSNIPHHLTRLYYYATDIQVLSSLYEGSPNVIKEGMVCNCPMVSTNVGDVSNLFEGVEGNFIAGPAAVNFSTAMQQALAFAARHGRTKGREKIVSLGIDAATIAKKINNIYQQLKV